MSYQIDQSGKVEQTERDTVVALSNDNNLTIMLKRKTKTPPLSWGHVGKTSKSHNFGARVARGKLKANRVVSLEEIMELILE